jgi:hypothetical protein
MASLFILHSSRAVLVGFQQQLREQAGYSMLNLK